MGEKIKNMDQGDGTDALFSGGKKFHAQKHGHFNDRTGKLDWTKVDKVTRCLKSVRDQCP